MVNNNGIPIEVNKKPFETVYEIKNEMPSFEEFMKTYENDGSLNYDDLSGDSVGEVKGYGPCYRCSVRYDCNCETGERWCDLEIGCPAKGCPNEELITTWVHSTDRYRTQISNKARMRCSKTGCEVDHMKNWSFRCNHSWHDGKFKKTSSLSFVKALNVASDNRAMDNGILKDLSDYLGKPENKWQVNN